jgi:hypothetical protein
VVCCRQVRLHGEEPVEAVVGQSTHRLPDPAVALAGADHLPGLLSPRWAGADGTSTPYLNPNSRTTTHTPAPSTGNAQETTSQIPVAPKSSILRITRTILLPFDPEHVSSGLRRAAAGGDVSVDRRVCAR